jgi:hypothetical protein
MLAVGGRLEGALGARAPDRVYLQCQPSLIAHACHPELKRC